MEEEKISVKQHEQEIRRWFTAFLIVLLLFVGAVAGWIISEKKHFDDNYGQDYLWLVPDEDPGEGHQVFG